VYRRYKEEQSEMTAKTQQDALTAVLIEGWEKASRKLEELADAVPENAFDSRRATDIRSVSEVLRHVAFWNQYVADTLKGKQADDTGNELSPASCPTKASILKALKQSSGDAAAALRERQGPVDGKTAELIVSFVEHTSEHYGQLAVYARLMGIVPPASRT
jgi:uncharacterized damage-inducible protein DinB